jgi:hypothetical protein
MTGWLLGVVSYTVYSVPKSILFYLRYIFDEYPRTRAFPKVLFLLAVLRFFVLSL